MIGVCSSAGRLRGLGDGCNRLFADAVGTQVASIPQSGSGCLPGSPFPRVRRPRANDLVRGRRQLPGLSPGTPTDSFCKIQDAINAAGAFQYVSTFGSGFDDRAYGVAMDDLGAVLVTGRFQATTESPAGHGHGAA
jgi:hypothetical protein